jgi:hypothetical protein
LRGRFQGAVEQRLQALPEFWRHFGFTTEGGFRYRLAVRLCRASGISGDDGNLGGSSCRLVAIRPRDASGQYSPGLKKHPWTEAGGSVISRKRRDGRCRSLRINTGVGFGNLGIPFGRITLALYRKCSAAEMCAGWKSSVRSSSDRAVWRKPPVRSGRDLSDYGV